MDRAIKRIKTDDYDFYLAVSRCEDFERRNDQVKLETAIKAAAKIYWNLQNEYEQIYGGKF